MISFNGGYIKHCGNNEVIFHDTLDRQTALDILELCRKVPDLIFHLHYEDDCYLENGDEFALFDQSDLNFKDPILVLDLSRFLDITSLYLSIYLENLSTLACAFRQYETRLLIFQFFRGAQ